MDDATRGSTSTNVFERPNLNLPVSSSAGDGVSRCMMVVARNGGIDIALVRKCVVRRAPTVAFSTPCTVVIAFRDVYVGHGDSAMVKIDVGL